MTSTITRLPDPLGDVNDDLICYTGALAFEPAGRYLAQVLYANARDVSAVAVYRRDNDQLTKVGTVPWDAAQGTPACCWWDRTGQWLIVSTMDSGAFGVSNDTYRLWIYHRDGDTLTRTGHTGADIGGIYLYPGNLAFDVTGRWVALAANQGTYGLAAFNPATGALTLADGATIVGGGGPISLAVAWHPTDATLLTAVDSSAATVFYRLSTAGGGHLTALDADTFNPSPGGTPTPVPTTTGALAWHPTGHSLYVDDQYGYGTYGLQQYTFGPPLTAGPQLADLGQVYNGYSIDDSGHFLAGGPGTTVSSYSCGGGNATGLGIELLNPADGSAAGPLLLDQSGENTTAYGDFVAWAPGTAGAASYLASSVSSWSYSYPWIPERWGVRLYRLDYAATSQLYARQPDGSFTVVGVAGQPLNFGLPDGSVRTWPGSGYPLYQRETDGTWKKVLG